MLALVNTIDWFAQVCIMICLNGSTCFPPQWWQFLLRYASICHIWSLRCQTNMAGWKMDHEDVSPKHGHLPASSIRLPEGILLINGKWQCVNASGKHLCPGLGHHSLLLNHDSWRDLELSTLFLSRLTCWMVELSNLFFFCEFGIPSKNKTWLRFISL